MSHGWHFWHRAYHFRGRASDPVLIPPTHLEIRDGPKYTGFSLPAVSSSRDVRRGRVLLTVTVEWAFFEWDNMDEREKPFNQYHDWLMYELRIKKPILYLPGAALANRRARKRRRLYF